MTTSPGVPVGDAPLLPGERAAGVSPLPPPRFHNARQWLPPVLMLGAAYGLLTLTFASHLSHGELMQRCVLVEPRLSRIWSVANIELGLAYIGVFLGMLFYFIGLYKKSIQHLRDLAYALTYLFGSFLLDLICVRSFEPFVAMLIGDAIVMTFTLIVSRQMWFQRLLGVFVPLIFLTCGVGHFLEGVSYWYLTYPINVPWTMVTADIGFAVLVNTHRFPAFIRGEDVIQELAEERTRTDALRQEIAAREAAEAEKARLLDELRESAAQKQEFLRDVLLSVTEGRLHLCHDRAELPPPRGETRAEVRLSRPTLAALRRAIRDAARACAFAPSRTHDIETAAGEAAMNSVVHADGGTATVRVQISRTPERQEEAEATIQVWVEDHGAGIALDSLPRATLERGYSSAGTLGHGFWMILQTADRVWLYTSPTGTVVVLEQDRLPEEAGLPPLGLRETRPGAAPAAPGGYRRHLDAMPPGPLQ